MAAELRSNILRSSLSLLGVTIGILCIITVLSAIDSLKRNLEASFDRLGSNVVYVQKWSWFAGEGGEYAWWEYVNRPAPDMEEYDMLRERLTLASSVSLQGTRSGKRVKFGRQQVRNATLSGVMNDFEKIYDLEFAAGRWFSFNEGQNGQSVAVIGSKIGEKLFPSNVDPIGKKIRIMGHRLTVIGVLASEGESMIDISNDEQVLVPYRFLHQKEGPGGPFQEDWLVLQAREGVANDELKDEIIPLMRAHRRIKPLDKNNFSINESTMITVALRSTFAVLNVIGWVVGAFALLVGGFGIANIMFVSVRERTPQIGIKKSLGAKNHFIFLEFLMESILLCLLGCTFGLILSWTALEIFERLADFEFVLSFRNVLIAVTVSSIIGTIFGMAPSIVAAKLDPVVAMRK